MTIHEIELQQCACVFDEHMHEVMVCVYHADIAARLAEAERLLREVHKKHWPFLTDGLHERIYDAIKGAPVQPSAEHIIAHPDERVSMTFAEYKRLTARAADQQPAAPSWKEIEREATGDDGVDTDKFMRALMKRNEDLSRELARLNKQRNGRTT